MSTLSEALAALAAAATTAGLDATAARTEGEALAATIAEPARGAYVDWCTQTGRASSAEEFTTAASRGRRYRSAPTPTMAALAIANSPYAGGYAKALSDVAMAACSLGEENARVIGNASTAAAAQLGSPGAVPITIPPPREPVPGVADHFLAQVMEQSRIVRDKLAALEHTPLLDERVDDPPPTQAAPPAEPTPPAEEPKPEVPQKTLEELLGELDALVGLTEVKAEIHRQAAVLRVEGLRKDAGLTGLTITRHLIFNGNPGTGKTTVARLVAGIYRALGLLSKGQLVEVDRSELVAGFLGQTAMKTADVVKSAIGGVLFIDEAYSLAGDQYGQEAIDTLVKEMEDHRADLVVIVAGYPVPMAIFIGQNPGLESRFRTEINFPDYTDDELVSIFSVMVAGAAYDADQAVLDRLHELIGTQQRGPSFGNARYVRNVLEAAIGKHAWRLRDIEKPTLDELRTLKPEDLDPVVPESPKEPVEWDPTPGPAEATATSTEEEQG